MSHNLLSGHYSDRKKSGETDRQRIHRSNSELQWANEQLALQIAERLQAEQKLRQTEFHYERLFENAVEGIYCASLKGRYTKVNPALANLLGYDSQTQLLDNLTNLQQDLYVNPQNYHQLLQQLSCRGFVKDFESQVYCQDGSIIWICENVEAVCDRYGNILYYEGFVTDITKQKLANEATRLSEAKYKAKVKQLDQALEQIQILQTQLLHSQKMSSLGQLMAGIAHEINNPVNFVYNNLTPTRDYVEDVLGLLDLYNQHYPEPVAEIQEEAEAIDLEFILEDLPKTLSSMELGSHRIREIVESLRNFSRLGEGRKKPVNLHDGIDSTLLILRNRLKEKRNHAEIQVIRDYGDLPAVECYGSLLNQVFMNLISNGIDALEPLRKKNSEFSPEIHISTEVVNGTEAVIRIRDNGIGMSEERKAKIFEAFYTTKPEGKGTGLGLSISHSIVVEKHGGKLECLSTPQQGTEFVITLPMV